jgi:hypothetical protein
VPKVFITCSATNTPVWTGLTVESRREFETTEGLLDDMACPACNRPHPWQVEDGYLDGESMKPPPGKMDRQSDEGGEQSKG